jgi:hypothetical protein
MFRRPLPATVPSGLIDLDQPHDTCLKCGRATPLGVSLCNADNPGRIKSPSATQVHGTIVVGVLIGFLALLLLFRLGSSGVSFASTLSGVATRPDGGLDIVVSVQNNGTHASGASCRISNAGAPDFRDFIFFSGPVPAGQTRQFTQIVPAVPGGAPLSASNLAVRCT